MYSIYTLSDPRDNQVRYVGLSKEPYRRYATHLLNTAAEDTIKTAWIEELRAIGTVPMLAVIDTVETKAIAEQREHHWIQFYTKQGVSLVNTGKMKTVPDYLQELEALIKAEGWASYTQTRWNQQYVYATRRYNNAVLKAYIAPVSRVSTLTGEQVQQKLKNAITNYENKKA